MRCHCAISVLLLAQGVIAGEAFDPWTPRAPASEWAHSVALIEQALTPGIDASLLMVGDSQSIKPSTNRLPQGIARTWPLDLVGWTTAPNNFNWWASGPFPFISGQVLDNPQSILGDDENDLPVTINQIRFDDDVPTGAPQFRSTLASAALDLFAGGNFADDQPMRARALVYINDEAQLNAISEFDCFAERDGATSATTIASFRGKGLRVIPETGPGLAVPDGCGDAHLRFISPAGLFESGKRIIFAGTHFYRTIDAKSDLPAPGKDLDSLSFSGWSAVNHANLNPAPGVRGYTDEVLLDYLDAIDVERRDSAVILVTLGHNDIAGSAVEPADYQAAMETIVQRYDAQLAFLGVSNRTYLLTLGWNRINVKDEALFEHYRDAIFTISAEGASASAGHAAVPAARIAAISLYHYFDGTLFGPDILDGVHPVSQEATDFLCDGWWDALTPASDPPPAPGYADLTGDGVTDTLDLLQLLEAWGPCPPSCPTDLTFDGVTDTLDLLRLLADWG